MRALFNETPYKFWVSEIRPWTYLFVTDSDDRARKFMADHQHAYEMPPFECGDGICGNSYFDRIWDWMRWGGDVMLHVGTGDIEEARGLAEAAGEYPDAIAESMALPDCLMVLLAKGAHPHDVFDLLYDLYDYPVEEELDETTWKGLR